MTLLPWLPVYLPAFQWQRVHYGAYSFFTGFAHCCMGSSSISPIRL